VLPIHAFIFKVTAFCNLNCGYCYMFNLKDRSFEGRPRVMPPRVMEAGVSRVAEYARDRGLKEVTIVLHGGEPLLAGPDWFRRCVRRFREAGGDETRYRFSLQTNGVLLDPSWIDLFRELGISVSLSMDGPPAIHDRNRPNHAGRGSHAEVVRGLKLLQAAPDLFEGVLCVVDPAEDGLETYRHFRGLGVTRLDFLLPLEYNWDHLPPRAEEPDATPFADYLLPVFDDWWREDDPGVHLRLFQQILFLILGAKRHLDSLGGDAVNLAVIETDGSLEPLDALRSCGDGFTRLGLDVLRDPVSALERHPLMRSAMAGQDGLCETCKDCPLHDTCGAGYLPNRYSDRNGFDNPTVYCRDLWKLISHVLDRVSERTAVRAA
jgi:uncharacterized protein